MHVVADKTRVLAGGSEDVVSCDGNSIFLDVNAAQVWCIVVGWLVVFVLNQFLQSLPGSRLNVIITSNANPSQIVAWWSFSVVSDACPVAVFPPTFLTFVVS